MKEKYSFNASGELLGPHNLYALNRKLSQPDYIDKTIAAAGRIMHPTSGLSGVVKYMAYLTETYEPQDYEKPQHPFASAYINSVKLGVGIVKSLRPDIKSKEMDAMLDIIGYQYHDHLAGVDRETRLSMGWAVIRKGLKVIDENPPLKSLAETVREATISDWSLVMPLKSGLGFGFDAGKRAAEMVDMGRTADEMAKGTVDIDRELGELTREQ